MKKILVEVSAGELLDKISILHIKLDKIKDKNSLDFKGWETIDSYSNDVSFEIKNLKTNIQIVDSFFKIPQEKDL